MTTEFANDLTRVYTLTVEFPVLLALTLCAVSVSLVVHLIIRFGWKWRCMTYSYLLALLALYAHFVFCGPLQISLDVVSMAYWTALWVGAPLTAAPIFAEWSNLKTLYPRFHVPSKKTVWRASVTLSLALGIQSVATLWQVLAILANLPNDQPHHALRPHQQESTQPSPRSTSPDPAPSPPPATRW